MNNSLEQSSALVYNETYRHNQTHYLFIIYYLLFITVIIAHITLRKNWYKTDTELIIKQLI